MYTDNRIFATFTQTLLRFDAHAIVPFESSTVLWCLAQNLHLAVYDT